MGRRGLTLGLLAFVAFVGHDARATTPTKQQCVNFNERGQELRQQRQLRAAREQFVACQNQSCPGAVRDDCTDQIEKLDRALPSILISVHGRSGESLQAVTVRIDRDVRADHLDGSALIVDPGDHEVSLEASGFTKKTVSIHAQEGIREQKVAVTLDPVSTTEPPQAVQASVASDLLAQPDANQKSADSPLPARRLIEYGLAGGAALGLALGAGFAIGAKAQYDSATDAAHCPKGPPICDAAGVDGVHGANTSAAVSTVSFVIAGVLAGAALVLWLTEPSSPTTKNVTALRSYWSW